MDNNLAIQLCLIPYNAKEILIKLGNDSITPNIMDLEDAYEIFCSLITFADLYVFPKNSNLILENGKNPTKEKTYGEGVYALKIPIDIEAVPVILVGDSDTIVSHEVLQEIKDVIINNNKDIPFLVSHAALEITYV